MRFGVPLYGVAALAGKPQIITMNLKTFNPLDDANIPPAEAGTPYN